MRISLSPPFLSIVLFLSLIAFRFAPLAHAADEPPVDLGDITEKHVMIPMRDGVRLSAYLYFPKGDGPWPVIYEQRYADTRAVNTRKAFARLAEGGYVVVVENFRGSQLSEGTWVGYRALGWGELKDGYDTVEWLAKQPWSTGKVGTFGSSQAGFAQNFLAITQPPHLVCQYMIDTGLSLFHEGYRIGGATKPERFKGMAAVCRDPEDNAKLMKEWFSHPNYDDYWKDEDCTRFIDKMNVPCFTIGSWYDFMCVGSVDSYVGRQHNGGPKSRGKQQLLLGPWLHGRYKETNRAGEMIYPENAKFGMEDHMIRWFDHYLKGIDNGVENDPTVRYYTMGALGEENAPGNEWRIAPDWPVKSTPTPYYLREQGKLTLSKADKEAIVMFKADPLHPAEIPARGFPGAADARAFEKQAEVKTFTTEPLKSPVEWTGKIQTEIYLASTAPDTDIIVRVSDVYPDGRSILIMDMIRRVRYREGFEKEVFLKPGVPVKVAFDVGWLSQIFNAGHQIRVTIASTGAPFYEPNPNTGKPLTIEFPEETQVASNTVFLGGDRASRIIAPEIKPFGEAALHSGQLSTGEQALQKALESEPKNDEMRFGLAIVQLVKGLERLGQSLYQYGVKSEHASAPFLRVPVPKNPDPAVITPVAFRRMLDDFRRDLSEVEETLAVISDDNVKLKLSLAPIRLDLDGDGEPTDQLIDILKKVMRQNFAFLDNNPNFTVSFDRGDVAWLRSYCHILMGLLDGQLAFDERLWFELYAKDVFARPKSSFEGTEEERMRLARVYFDEVRIVEPVRLGRFRKHLVQVTKLNRETWRFIRAEIDDDQEWLPNSGQTGVFGLPVTDVMVNSWLEMMSELEALFEGKRTFLSTLGEPWARGDKGLSIRAILDNPPEKFDGFEFLAKLPDEYFVDAPPVDFAVLFRTFIMFSDPSTVGYAAWFN